MNSQPLAPCSTTKAGTALPATDRQNQVAANAPHFIELPPPDSSEPNELRGVVQRGYN